MRRWFSIAAVADGTLVEDRILCRSPVEAVACFLRKYYERSFSTLSVTRGESE